MGRNEGQERMHEDAWSGQDGHRRKFSGGKTGNLEGGIGMEVNEGRKEMYTRLLQWR